MNAALVLSMWLALAADASGAVPATAEVFEPRSFPVTDVERIYFSGPGTLNIAQAGNLHSRSVEASVEGAGYILLAVDELLDVRLTGTASVRCVGSPFVSQTVSGPGSVAPVAARSI